MNLSDICFIWSRNKNNIALWFVEARRRRRRRRNRRAVATPDAANPRRGKRRRRGRSHKHYELLLRILMYQVT